MREKTAILVESFSSEASISTGGGFFWMIDSPENRESVIGQAVADSDDYTNVIVVAFSMQFPDVYDDTEITDMLDSDLVFEAGKAGEILYRSPGWVDIPDLPVGDDGKPEELPDPPVPGADDR